MIELVPSGMNPERRAEIELVEIEEGTEAELFGRPWPPPGDDPGWVTVSPFDTDWVRVKPTRLQRLYVFRYLPAKQRIQMAWQCLRGKHNCYDYWL